MPRFEDLFSTYRWPDVQHRIYTCTATDVRRALSRPRRTLDDFLALVSPAASPYLEDMARLSQALTQQRFGKTIQLFAPLYMSNECQNICTYCGFSQDNPIRRRTLTDTELLLEALALKAMGVHHVLLVSGEANKTVGIEYFSHAVRLLKPHFVQLSLEVQPLTAAQYETLHRLGVHAVLVYQETYHQDAYRAYHPKGRKSNFAYRLATPDRIGRARFHKIGLGVLLGLEDWRTDSFFNALHVDYLQRTYWRTRYSISFPRLRPAAGVELPKYEISDAELVQLLCAYRIWNPDLELSISTREHEIFRNHVIRLGATTMSAASKTNPGGYAVDPQSLEQFEISDERSMEAVKAAIRAAGYEPVMKDWEKSYSNRTTNDHRSVFTL